jgi:uroporphyrinogen-III decarboxylase
MPYIEYSEDDGRIAEGPSQVVRDFGPFHIVGAGCEMPPVTSAENLRTMVRYAREHQPEEFAFGGSMRNRTAD